MLGEGLSFHPCALATARPTQGERRAWTRARWAGRGKSRPGRPGPRAEPALERPPPAASSCSPPHRARSLSQADRAPRTPAHLAGRAPGTQPRGLCLPAGPLHTQGPRASLGEAVEAGREAGATLVQGAPCDAEGRRRGPVAAMGPRSSAPGPLTRAALEPPGRGGARAPPVCRPSRGRGPASYPKRRTPPGGRG